MQNELHRALNFFSSSIVQNLKSNIICKKSNKRKSLFSTYPEAHPQEAEGNKNTIHCGPILHTYIHISQQKIYNNSTFFLHTA